MKKKILFSLIVFAMLGTPVCSHAEAAIEVIEQEMQQIAVTFQDNVLHVVGANGQTLMVYNVAGVRLMNIKVEGADRRIELNLPKGCYIVKVGKTVRKISVK